MLTEVFRIVSGHDRRFDAHDRRFDEHDRRFDAIEARLDAHDRRFDEHDRRFDEHTNKLNELIVTVNGHSRKLDELAAIVNRHDRKLDELGTGVADLREALTQYHASVLGHSILISEIDERLRRVERHLNLDPATGCTAAKSRRPANDLARGIGGLLAIDRGRRAGGDGCGARRHRLDHHRRRPAVHHPQHLGGARR